MKEVNDCLVDLLFEDDKEELIEEEYLEEKGDYKKDSKSLERFICSLFAHMLKFKYQKERQSRSWLLSINDRNNKIFDLLYKRSGNIYTDVIAPGYLDDRFVEAIAEAESELPFKLTNVKSRPIE